jgi:peptidoglycan-N-acetylglucosamine deacetylase
MAYLTIDDAPSARFAEKLAYLRKEGIPATLFCQGLLAEGREEELARAVGEGFVLGNHSWSHPRFSAIPLEECLREIERTDRLLASVYSRAGAPWPLKLFRFPFLDHGGAPEREARIQTLLRRLGYRAPGAQSRVEPIAASSVPDRADTDCSFDQKEYYFGKAGAPEGLDRAEAILARIGPGRPGPGDIVLIHDHEDTHELFFECVERYRSHGIAFEPLG